MLKKSIHEQNLLVLVNGTDLEYGFLTDMEKGGEIAQLVELYDYCIRGLREYLSEKDVEKIQEIHQIISKLSEGWDQIDPGKLEQQ